MSTLMDLWLSWAYYFKALPFGDYVAAFVLVVGVIFVLNRLKAAMWYV